MQSWRVKNLGDAMLAGDDLESVQTLFQHTYEQAGFPEDMAIYVRHEAEGRLHCEVKLYFSPAISEFAEALGARCCPQPSFEGLGLLVGSDEALPLV